MSRTALMLMALVQPAGEPIKPVYGPHLPVVQRARPASQPCPPMDQRKPDEVLVCGRRDNDAERMPLREARFEEGEVVRHPGEPPRPLGGGSVGAAGTGDPSKAPETIRRVLAWIRGADPD